MAVVWSLALFWDSALLALVADCGLYFTAAAWKEDVLGMQFYPEKSQGHELRLLQNFAEL